MPFRHQVADGDERETDVLRGSVLVHAVEPTVPVEPRERFLNHNALRDCLPRDSLTAPPMYVFCNPGSHEVAASHAARDQRDRTHAIIHPPLGLP